jgi:hypothetical protein
MSFTSVNKGICYRNKIRKTFIYPIHPAIKKLYYASFWKSCANKIKSVFSEDHQRCNFIWDAFSVLEYKYMSLICPEIKNIIDTEAHMSFYKDLPYLDIPKGANATELFKEKSAKSCICLHNF